jgi:hypothetical protein
MFQINISPPSSGSKNKPSKNLASKQMAEQNLPLAFMLVSFLGLFVDPEDGGDMLL